MQNFNEKEKEISKWGLTPRRANVYCITTIEATLALIEALIQYYKSGLPIHPIVK